MDHTPPLVIPGYILKKDLSHTAMVLYGLIFSLQREEGYAYASNAFYAEYLNLSIASVKRYLKELVDKKYIVVHVNRKSQDSAQRKIYLSSAWTTVKSFEAEEGGQLKSEPCILVDIDNTKKKEDILSREELAEAVAPIYAKYPNKIGRGLGIDRLFTKKFKRSDVPLFAAAVENYSRYCREKALEERFILHFSTFVGRWRDWIKAEIKGSSTTVVAKSLEDLSELFKPQTWNDSGEK